MTMKCGTNSIPCFVTLLIKNKLVIYVHVVVDIIGNILNIPRDVGSHTNTKHQVFSFLAKVKTILYLDSLHLICREEQIIKKAK